jgi:hypothetical protein
MVIFSAFITSHKILRIKRNTTGKTPFFHTVTTTFDTLVPAVQSIFIPALKKTGLKTGTYFLNNPRRIISRTSLHMRNLGVVIHEIDGGVIRGAPKATQPEV